MDRKIGSRPSIRDVARSAGVSPGCVSNVINGRRKQDDPIGRAVHEAIEKLGYRRNTIASNLRRSQSRFIGLVIPDFENPFFAELVAQLEQQAEGTQYRIVATSSREDPEIELRELDELAGWPVAGILLVPSMDSRCKPVIQTSDKPVVVIDRIIPDSDLDVIAVDNFEASAEGMRRLLELGHRRILIAYLDDGIVNVDERLAGVRAAAAQHSDELEVNFLATGPDVEGARQRIGDLLDENPGTTAIFCLFNSATLAAYGAAQARNLRLGQGLALLSFDDSTWMSQVQPAVAAIIQPVAEIARQAWERILTRIDAETEPAGIVRVRCELSQRETLIAANGVQESASRTTEEQV